MFKKTRSLLLNMLVSLFAVDFCNSASLIALDTYAKRNHYYSKFSSGGIHLPILLTADSKMKAYICDQIIDSRLFKDGGYRRIDLTDPLDRARLLTYDGKATFYPNGDISGERVYPISVQNLLTNFPKDITLECLVVEDTKEGARLKKFLVSYGFMPRSYFVSVERYLYFKLVGFGDLSPTLVQFEQKELEAFYLNFRLPMDRLRRHRPEVERAIRHNGPLSSLMPGDRVKLCSAIFELDIYKPECHMSYTFTMTDKQGDMKKMPLKFVTRNIVPPMITENIICSGEQNKKDVLLYLTDSFNGENSLFVQKQEGDFLILDAYIKDISSLGNFIDAQSHWTYDFELL